jgi:DNA-binding PadR family transcriptional regulator
MTDDARLPLRPADDPSTLASQLVNALRALPADGERYQGYLAQIVRSCVLALHDGDLEAPAAGLDLLAPALHVGERLVGSQEAIEAAAWVRATSQFFEVAKEALAPRFTLETFAARDRSETEREVLRILLQADRTPQRRGEIVERWAADHAAPTPVRIGQILASLHEAGLVVRVKQRAQGGSDVAFYRLSVLGRELCDRLHLRVDAPTRLAEGLITSDAFYDRLASAVFADTSEPLYLSTFVEPAADSNRALTFHDSVVARASQIRRPIEWIFVPSNYLDQVFRPGIAAARIPVQLYEHRGGPILGPTVQVFGDGGCAYPIAERTALAMPQDVALATWKRHQAGAIPVT